LVDVRAARLAVVRRARRVDVAGVAALVAEWAARGLLLPRSAADVLASIHDYVVAVDPAGRVLACAAVREYAPSLAEVVSVAVSSAAQGGGLGARVVAAAEALAWVRGHAEVFAHTQNPSFFTAIGYECVDRGRYPEKRGRAVSTCVRRRLEAGEAATPAPRAGFGASPVVPRRVSVPATACA
jgi:amino-acid N-acetyltransferase